MQAIKYPLIVSDERVLASHLNLMTLAKESPAFFTSFLLWEPVSQNCPRSSLLSQMILISSKSSGAFCTSSVVLCTIGTTLGSVFLGVYPECRHYVTSFIFKSSQRKISKYLYCETNMYNSPQTPNLYINFWRQHYP